MRTQMMTITLGIALIVSLAAAALAQIPDFKGFPDVPKNHWAYQAVTDLARRGIVQGYPAEGGGGKLKAKPIVQADAAGKTKTTPKRVTKRR